MERMGMIIESKGAVAKIKLMRHTACGSCGACQLGDDQKDILLTAKNEVSAEIGDVVEVGMPTAGILSAAFIMYVIPLIGLFLGLGIGTLVFKSGDTEVYAGLLGLGIMALAFLVIKLNEKRILKSDKYTAHILSIVQKHHDDLITLQTLEN
ncbi:SoxR reducing system RseC family protein [Fusibacter sp. JL298sf-3]